MEDLLECFRKMKDDAPFRRKVCITCAVFFSYIMQGWSDQQIGMTLLDLQRLIGANQETISTIMIVWDIGRMFGSLISGVMFDNYNRLVQMFAITVALAVGTVLLPYCSFLAWMLVCRFFLGAFNSASDTGANTIIPTLWGEKCGPFVQLLYVCFAIGGILSPYATLPFAMKNLYTDPEWLKAFNNSDFATITSNTTFAGTFDNSKLHFTFMITGLLYIACALPYFVLRFCGQSDGSSRNEVGDYETIEDSVVVDNAYKNGSLKPKTAVLICLMGAIHALFIAIEENLMVFLVPFCFEYLHLSNTDSATLMSSYWITSCIVGSFGIVVAAMIDPSTILWLSLILTNFSFILVVVGIFSSQVWLLWFGFISSGCGMIMVVPSVFSWSQKYACEISGKVSSFFIVTAGLCGGTSSYLIGHMMEHHSKLYFVYILTSCTMASLLFYTGAYFLRFKTGGAN